MSVTKEGTWKPEFPYEDNPKGLLDCPMLLVAYLLVSKTRGMISLAAESAASHSPLGRDQEPPQRRVLRSQRKAQVHQRISGKACTELTPLYNNQAHLGSRAWLACIRYLYVTHLRSEGLTREGPHVASGFIHPFTCWFVIMNLCYRWKHSKYWKLNSDRQFRHCILGQKNI